MLSVANKLFILSVGMLGFVMLSVVMLSVVMLSVIMLIVVMLSVVMLNVVEPMVVFDIFFLKMGKIIRRLFHGLTNNFFYRLGRLWKTQDKESMTTLIKGERRISQ